MGNLCIPADPKVCTDLRLKSRTRTLGEISFDLGAVTTKCFSYPETFRDQQTSHLLWESISSKNVKSESELCVISVYQSEIGLPAWEIIRWVAANSVTTSCSAAPDWLVGVTSRHSSSIGAWLLYLVNWFRDSEVTGASSLKALIETGWVQSHGQRWSYGGVTFTWMHGRVSSKSFLVAWTSPVSQATR